jgi:15-cis-phytoene synthase
MAMDMPQNGLDASYAFCRRQCRRAGSSFYVGFRLLPHEKRRAMDALYAFMRYTDDLTDSPELADIRDELISLWRTRATKALSGDLAGLEAALQSWNMQDTAKESLLTSDPKLRQLFFGDLLLPALADTAERFQIPHEHLLAVIDGVAMDLHPQTYATFDDLRPYCERVASAVGLACIHVWGFHGPEALQHATNAGIALQLTNILRDVKEDGQTGRLYLPLADLRACGYSADDLWAGVDNEGFRRLMAMEIARAETFYRDGVLLMECLKPQGRRIFGLMMTTYYALLNNIAQRPAEVLRGRIRLSKSKRLALAARWALFPTKKINLS